MTQGLPDRNPFSFFYRDMFPEFQSAFQRAKNEFVSRVRCYVVEANKLLLRARTGHGGIVIGDYDVNLLNPVQLCKSNIHPWRERVVSTDELITSSAGVHCVNGSTICDAVLQVFGCVFINQWQQDTR